MGLLKNWKNVMFKEVSTQCAKDCGPIKCTFNCMRTCNYMCMVVFTPAQTKAQAAYLIDIFIMKTKLLNAHGTLISRTSLDLTGKHKLPTAKTIFKL